MLSKGCQDSEVNEKKTSAVLKQELKTWGMGARERGGGGGAGVYESRELGKLRRFRGGKLF